MFHLRNYAGSPINSEKKINFVPTRDSCFTDHGSYWFDLFHKVLTQKMKRRCRLKNRVFDHSIRILIVRKTQSAFASYFSLISIINLLYLSSCRFPFCLEVLTKISRFSEKRSKKSKFHILLLASNY